MTRPLAGPLAQNGKNHGNLRRVASLALLTTAISSLTCEQAAADPSVMWNGSVNNNWFVDGNWVWDGITPTATTTARIDKAGVTIAGNDAFAKELLVGLSATGDLTINSTLTTTTATLGYNNGSTGSVFLSGAGVSWQNSGSLTVGNAGAGIISLGYLASMEAGTTYLGGAAGGSGSLEISGGATFTSNSDLYVGYGGAGSVTVTSGTLHNVNGNLADGIGSTGTATITGASSSWTNSGALRVGGGGVGALTVSDGGTVTSGSGVIGHLTSANGSSVVVTGTGSTWTSSGSIIVGNIGASELDVLSGGAVTSSGAMIGRHSTSTAKVSGAGSSWNTGNLYIGGDDTDSTTPRGNGTLIVSGGGSVTSSGVRLGLNSGDSGTASVSGSGSVWNTGGANTVLSVGFNGTGTVSVSDNARLETAWAIIGHNASSTGSVTISNGARLTDTGSLYVGNEGTGTLTVASGGDVTSTDGFVGTGNGSHGTATVTGSGSSWNMAGALFVGQNTGSTGTMTISDGATVSDYQGIVGDLAGSSGSLTVTGAGSTWASVVTNGQAYSGDINAGRLGNGTITVSNGGKITGNRFYAGNEAHSSGTVLITGADSSITTTDRFVVGSEGTGTATVTRGGTISTGIIKIADQAGSTGTLNVGAAQGAAAAAAGTLDTKAIAFGAGTGVLEFNFTDPSYVVSAAISGAGKVRLDAGNLTLSGTNTYTQGTEINGGTLNVTGSLSGSATEVTLSGGQLANSGSISGSSYGVRLATSGNTVTNSGAISGGTASVFFGADRNTLNILPTGTFDGLVDYNNTIGNTTSFGAGSYRIAASKYLDAANTIALNNTSQTVILDRANTSSGYINVVSIPSASQAATQYTSSVSDVVGSILGLDVARPDQVTIGETTISALQYGEEKPETKEAKALRMLSDNVAVDGYGNLFWARVFGGLRYQPSNDGDFSSHTSHYGLISGVDHQFENHRLGFFAGGGSVRSVAGDGASIMTGNTGFLGLYGAIELEGFQWNASITGGGIDNEASRTINNGAETASGDFMGWYVSPELSVSRGYQIAPRWQLTPSVKARYTGAFYDGYDEKGSSQNVSFDARQTHSLDGRLQVELKHQVALPSGLPATVTATAALGDTQYLGSGRVRANLDNNEFTVSSSADKNVVGASVGVGFDAMVSERTAVYGGIDGTLYSDKSMSASGRLGVKLAF